MFEPMGTCSSTQLVLSKCHRCEIFWSGLLQAALAQCFGNVFISFPLNCQQFWVGFYACGTWLGLHDSHPFSPSPTVSVES